jgi:lysosomal Pro-X carboxypeptidase
LVREAFRRIDEYKVKSDYSVLNKAFKTCTPITNITGVLGLEFYVNTAYTYMSMTNYPYETKFLKKLPRWPASTSCEKLVNISMEDNDETFFEGIRGSIEVYYNYENLTDCNEVWASDQSSD